MDFLLTGYLAAVREKKVKSGAGKKPVLGGTKNELSKKGDDLVRLFRG